jgi:hypothetical protein
LKLLQDDEYEILKNYISEYTKFRPDHNLQFEIHNTFYLFGIGVSTSIYYKFYVYFEFSTHYKTVYENTNFIIRFGENDKMMVKLNYTDDLDKYYDNTIYNLNMKSLNKIFDVTNKKVKKEFATTNFEQIIDEINNYSIIDLCHFFEKKIITTGDLT